MSTCPCLKTEKIERIRGLPEKIISRYNHQILCTLFLTRARDWKVKTIEHFYPLLY